ncbi:MAG TPA: amidohydrolase family protein [Methylomirabilota bacterium]|nr:amidohydrolase family protein [Methylomirabilota bacterium]
MDLILRNARIAGAADPAALADIGIEGGRIAHVGPRLSAPGREIDIEGRLVSPGFVETHIHLDKSRLLDRCRSDEGTLEEAIGQVAAAKKAFTAEDVHRRGAATLEQAILQGTTHMRTHLEVDPGIGLRGFEGVRPLVDEYRWGIDLQICVFPQEGLLNNPGTDELMVAALRQGARAVGAAPYTDSNPKGQIDRVFELAREFDVDIDMHLDFGHTADDWDIEYVCAQTERYHYGGRVAVGHVTKLSVVPPKRLEEVGRRAAGAGVALTVLPATDLYLMGRHQEHSVLRGVVPVHKLLALGVNCSLSSNNILNPFTPFGDCSLVRIANLYANIAQVGKRDGARDCFEMITRRSARLLRLDDYGLAVGKSADLVVLDCASTEAAVAEVATPLFGLKRGRMTFRRERPQLLRPS